MLVECVPNFSAGRDQAHIDGLVAAAASVPGAALLDRHSDVDHNRTVLTLAGAPQAVSEAVFRAVSFAVLEIDMGQQAGVHPRIGAADVVPFVPLSGAKLSDCVTLAQELGQRLAEELQLPIYFYAEAARTEERRRLPWIRRPGYEGLAAALASEERAPDLGPRRPHPSAGACVVGARGLLVAFNVDLETEDLALAKRIAKEIRASSGGLPGVQARGMALAEQGRVQVSMNLLQPDLVGPGRVVQEIACRAAAAGVEIAGSELVGLLPRAALSEAGEHALRLSPPLGGRILEERLAARLPDPGGPLRDYLRHLGAAGPFDPGGGSAACQALALGRACLGKAWALSRGGRGSLSDQELDELVVALPGEDELLTLAGEDHLAFANLMDAWRLERSAPGRKDRIAAARAPAVAVGEQTLEWAVALAEAGARLAEDGNKNLVNDAVAAVELAVAGARVARLNSRANQRKAARQDYSQLLVRLEAALSRARQAGAG